MDVKMTNSNHSDSLFRDELCRRINSRATELGLKQADIVKKLDAPKSTVNGWFTGTSQPKGYTLTQLSTVLKCSLEWLLSGVGSTISPVTGFTLDGFPGTWEYSSTEPSPYVKVPSLDPIERKVDKAFLKLAPASAIENEKSKASIGWFLCGNDSANPVINNGDTLLINSSINEVLSSGSYYLFYYGNSAHVHRAFVNVDGSLSLEDASRPNTPIVLPSEDASVLGKVIYSSGAL